MGESMTARIGRILLGLFVAFWLLFLLLPIIVTAIASLTSSSYLIFPPPGFSLKWYEQSFRLDWFWPGLANSAIIAITSTAIAVGIGILAARVLARHRIRGRVGFEYVVLSPLIIPGVVVGFALFNFVTLLEFNDFAMFNLIAAHTVVTIPFTVRSIWSSMAGSDISLEDAAQSLGATPWVTFWRVTFPLIVPGIVAGSIIAFTFSFNDVTVSAFLVGQETRTLPVELMAHIEYIPDPSPAAVSSLMILLTLAFFFLIERTVGLDAFTEK